MDYRLKANDNFHLAGENKEMDKAILESLSSNKTAIRKPLGNEISQKVKSWKQIKKQAWALKEFIDAKKFEGNWEDAYAISHTQVCAEPFNFFVLNKSKEKKFGHWCIINLKIVKKSEESIFPEGCMSFMFREMKKVDRWAHITVTYWTPFLNLFLIPHRRKFKNIDAFICQHEHDHSQGINIYGK